jgi:hypothetical protein
MINDKIFKKIVIDKNATTRVTANAMFLNCTVDGKHGQLIKSFAKKEYYWIQDKAANNEEIENVLRANLPKIGE